MGYNEFKFEKYVSLPMTTHVASHMTSESRTDRHIENSYKVALATYKQRHFFLGMIPHTTVALA